MSKKTASKIFITDTNKDFSNARNPVWGVAARNPERHCALELLMDHEVDLVTPPTCIFC